MTRGRTSSRRRWRPSARPARRRRDPGEEPRSLFSLSSQASSCDSFSLTPHDHPSCMHWCETLRPRVPRETAEEASAREAAKDGAGVPPPPPSPFHPPTAGWGVVPRGRQPKREEDWWAPDDLDPELWYRYGGDGDGGVESRVRGDGAPDGSGVSGRGRDGEVAGASPAPATGETAGVGSAGDGEGDVDSGGAVRGSERGRSHEDTWWDLAELDQNIVREATSGKGGVIGAVAAAAAKRHVGDFAEWGDADYSAGRFHSQTPDAAGETEGGEKEGDIEEERAAT